MTEVFITDIQNKEQTDSVYKKLNSENSHLKIDFDLNETDISFPCGHTILRVEGNSVNTEKILATIKSMGINCEILEDKVCV